MRNLKKALALALASVMLMGMMVVGTSATFTDVTATDNVEAIEVLKAVGVMIGDDGKFNPDKNVSRNEFAVIMTNLLDLDTAAYSGTTPFTDIPAWAEPFVAACYANGIVSGTSATTYGGEGGVTATQAALMVMKALGYFQYASDFGADWQLATVKQADKISLFKGIDTKVTATLTRNEAAQLVLNALKATMVEADDNGIGVNTEGTLVSKYKYVDYKTASTGNTDTNDAISATNDGAGKDYVQLGEDLFDGKLKLVGSQVDGMDRPAHKWTYKGEDIGKYADTADKTFVISKTTGTKATLIDWLKSVNEDYYVSTSGTPATPDALSSGNFTTGNLFVNSTGTNYGGYTMGIGDVVEIFENAADANKIDKVIVTRNTMYKIDKVDTDVNTTDAKNGVKAYITLKNGSDTPYIVNDKDIVGFDAETYVKGAYIAGVLEIGSPNKVLSSYAVKATEGTVTAYTASKYTVNGTVYEETATTDTYNKFVSDDFEGTYAFYQDANGYVIGIVDVKVGKLVTDAVYVADMWVKSTTGDYDVTTTKYYAQVVDMNGVASNLLIGYTTTAGKIVGVCNGLAYTAADTITSGEYFVLTDGTITNTYGSVGSARADKGYTATAAVSSGNLYTISEDSTNGISKLTAYTGNDTVKIAKTNTSFAGLASTATKITTASGAFTTSYRTDATKYIVIEGTKDNIEIAVKTGDDVSINTTAGTAATVIANKVNTAYEAAYVIIPTTAYAGSASTDILFVDSATSKTVKDGEEITVYKMDGTTATIVMSNGSVSANGFYTYTVDSKGVYTLTQITTGTNFLDNAKFDGADWDEDADTGVRSNVEFISAYGDMITLKKNGNELKDIVAGKAVIVDKHEKNQDEFIAVGAGNFDSTSNAGQNTYAGAVDSIEAMTSVTEAGYKVTLSVYVDEDGAQLIVIKEVSK